MLQENAPRVLAQQMIRSGRLDRAAPDTIRRVVLTATDDEAQADEAWREAWKAEHERIMRRMVEGK